MAGSDQPPPGSGHQVVAALYLGGLAEPLGQVLEVVDRVGVFCVVAQHVGDLRAEPLVVPGARLRVDAVDFVLTLLVGSPCL